MSNRKSVYLAGPISGTVYGDSVDWRNVVTKALEPLGIDCFSPMRGKAYLEALMKARPEFKQLGDMSKLPLSTSKGIMSRDFKDATTSGAIIVNMDVPHSKPSLGTVMEIAWAFHEQKPVIMVDSPVHKYREHPMIFEAVPFWAEDLEQAIDLARIILLA